MADLIDDAVNAGTGAGKIQFAATADTTFSTLLAEITCQDPAFSAASSGVITLQGTPLRRPTIPAPWEFSVLWILTITKFFGVLVPSVVTAGI